MRDVAFAGDLAVAYIARQSVGVITLDISDPFHIAARDTLHLSRSYHEVECSRNRIYLLLNSFNQDEIQIVDAVDPSTLRLAGSITVLPVLTGYHFNTALRMEAQAHFLLLGTKEGVRVFDVSNADQPVESASYYSGFAVPALARHETAVYLGVNSQSSFPRGFFALQLDSSTVSVEERKRAAGIPKTFALRQNFPNPFNPETVIRYQLPAAAEAELAIYDLQGRRIRTLVSGRHNEGFYEAAWDGRDQRGAAAPSGLYLYRLRAGEQAQTRKMLLVK